MKTYYKIPIYMLRWQLTTFPMNTVMLVAKYCGVNISWEQVAIANAVCSPFFYYVDKYIIVHLDKHATRFGKWLKQIPKRVWRRKK